MLVNGDDFYCGNSKLELCQLALNSSVESLKTSVSDGKKIIAAAVTDKGVKTAADSTFQVIANNIASITTLNSSKISIEKIDGSVTTEFMGSGYYPSNFIERVATANSNNNNPGVPILMLMSSITTDSTELMKYSAEVIISMDAAGKLSTNNLILGMRTATISGLNSNRITANLHYSGTILYFNESMSFYSRRDGVTSYSYAVPVTYSKN